MAPVSGYSLPLYPNVTHAFFETVPANDLNWYDPNTGKTFVYNSGDISWMFASTALVALMIPGAGFFYSGLLRDGSALSMLYLSMMTLAVVSFQVRPSPVLLSSSSCHLLIVGCVGFLPRVQ